MLYYHLHTKCTFLQFTSWLVLLPHRPLMGAEKLYGHYQECRSMKFVTLTLTSFTSEDLFFYLGTFIHKKQHLFVFSSQSKSQFQALIFLRTKRKESPDDLDTRKVCQIAQDTIIFLLENQTWHIELCVSLQCWSKVGFILNWTEEIFRTRKRNSFMKNLNGKNYIWVELGK